MKLLNVGILLSSVLLTACSSQIHRSEKSGALEVKLKSDLQAELDIDMTKKISGTASQKRVLWFITVDGSHNYADGVTYGNEHGGWHLFGPGIVEETKSSAAYKAIVPNKADVIVAPQYLTKVKSYFFGIWKDVTTQVTGYGAKIRHIKQTARN